MHHAAPQDAMAAYDGLEYCKTDLVAAKGVVFCKFTKASAALQALEDVTVRGTVSCAPVVAHRGQCFAPVVPGRRCSRSLLVPWDPTLTSHRWRRPTLPTTLQVASYKVKCMLAEPKTKRGRSDGSPQEMQAFSPMMQVRGRSASDSITRVAACLSQPQHAAPNTVSHPTRTCVPIL